MDEGEFDSPMPLRPFGVDDAIRWQARARRTTVLGIALWGKTPDDLHRQLLAPHPEMPAGFDLADFRELQKSIRSIAAQLDNPRHAWLSSLSYVRAYSSPATMVVGTRHLSGLEARCEIVRRAIEYLENRGR